MNILDDPTFMSGYVTKAAQQLANFDIRLTKAGAA